MTVSVDDIAKQMLALLPDDGTPVLNRVMRVMLSQALAETIDEDRYYEARSFLRSASMIDIRGGQGGQIFLKSKSPNPESKPERSATAWSEAKLMPWLKKYLDGPFPQATGLLRGAKCLLYDTSTSGPGGVRWARPDFTLIAAKKFKFLPNVELDVHSFELKTETGATDLAVYEALAQTRFTHFGYLVWHLPVGSKSEMRLTGIQKQCAQHGIGFIRVREPETFGTWEIIIEPKRKPTLADEVDQFLDERLLETQRRDILDLISGSHHG